MQELLCFLKIKWNLSTIEFLSFQFNKFFSSFNTVNNKISSTIKLVSFIFKTHYI